ncbi:MAG: phosphate signaling complex protein PhoU [Planctomycetota bacterium]|jgi:phosphate transport system protein
MAIDLKDELATLRSEIRRMGSRVEERIGQCLDGLVRGDDAACRLVRDGDDEIDDAEISIEEECLQVLARLQPVAGDLRFVLAVMRLSTYLERIADHAQRIARRVLELRRDGDVEPPDGLVEMAVTTRAMLVDALQALATGDPGLARDVRLTDDRVDDLQREMFAWTRGAIGCDVTATAHAIALLSVARRLERIADLSTSIAKEVIFIAEGALVRHTPA